MSRGEMRKVDTSLGSIRKQGFWARLFFFNFFCFISKISLSEGNSCAAMTLQFF